MSKMVKEIAGLCYHLDKLHIGEKDNKIRKEIGENFDKMSDILDKAIRAQLDENELLYKKSVRKIRKYSKKIERESGLLEKYEFFFEGLSSLGEQLEELLKSR
ncbi:MAG: hypothetical protein ABFR36_03475 [Acidobacteriota bacterium]